MKGQRSTQHNSFREFLQDARGSFNVFTLISLQAGLTLVTAPLVCRVQGWQPLEHEETGALVLIYCISALGDYLLSIFLNKMPSTIVQTDGGPASLTTDGDANAGVTTPAMPNPNSPTDAQP